MATYRKPTEKESEKLNKSREKMIQGIEGEKDIFSKMMPTMAKSARDDIRAAKAMRESVPESAREGEAYQDAGYKEGGKVSSKLKNAGFYDKDKTTSARQKIVSKVTTKPQRVAMVEKAFSTKNMKSGGEIKNPTMSYQSYSKTGKPAGMKTVTVKKASGGSVSSASKRADGCAVRGKTKA